MAVSASELAPAGRNLLQPYGKCRNRFSRHNLFLQMATTDSPISSPFLNCGPTAQPDSLAVLHLKRDHFLPTVLRSGDDENEGYAEGKVTNTRFGSFPHSTLIGVPWGSQVRASAVDTGSRGRKGWEGTGKKRKRGEGQKPAQDDEGEEGAGMAEKVTDVVEPKEAKAAATGFVHLLPPTPEIWTASLPHRTQVVYTPDYSYILDRIRARPGTVLIEAGAGSGSFTHAAARAVYNGGVPATPKLLEHSNRPRQRQGKVYSFEFHEQRARKLQSEIGEHGLADIVTLTHQDVCSHGFIPTGTPSTPPSSVAATSIFLDLPAPWLALKHLTRQTTLEHPSPLSPHHSIHLCTFSPCIEQVTRTISTLRAQGWLDISMVEIAAKRIEVRRERVGLQEEGLRGVNDHPANVEEALQRLREVEGRTRKFHEESGNGDPEDRDAEPDEDAHMVGDDSSPLQQISKQQRLENIRLAQADRKLYKEGRLTHRSEPELKTHTSYLVFAILPREWSEDEEKEARRKWPGKVVDLKTEKAEDGTIEEESKPVGKKARKRAKKAEREMKEKAKQNGSIAAEGAMQEDGDGDDIKPDATENENEEADAEHA